MTQKPSIPIVTLLTDFGYRDGFVGVMKGVMLDVNPVVKIVDLSHEINPHDIQSAAFVLGQSYAYFPENTLHVVVVDPGVGTDRNILYVEAGYYRFLAPDNGVLQYIFKWEQVYRIIAVKNNDYFLPEQSSTFHGRDIFAPVAAHLMNGINPKNLGEMMDAKNIILPSKPEIEEESVRGEIVYIDHFGNLITNISNELILNLIKENKNLCIMLADQEIDKISHTFFSEPLGCLLAYLDSSEFLAFAINGQNAAEKMGISIGDRFEIVIN